MISTDLKRTVPLLGKVSSESVGRVLLDVVKHYEDDPQKKVTLFICSGGGSVDSGFMLADVLTTLVLSGCNLVVIGSGLVGSMAIPIFMCGKERYITTHTRFFFHELGFTPGSDGRMSTSGAEAKAKSLAMIQTWYAELIQKNSEKQITAETVQRLMKEESYLYPQDLLERGIVHKVL